MSKIQFELAKYIRSNFPVVKKRSALWFFCNEIKNNLSQCQSKGTQTLASTTAESINAINRPAPDDDNGATRDSYNAKVPEKISRNKILLLWKKLDHESKRKYFNMSQFDELRYEEQKSLWISEVGSLMLKHAGSIPEVENSVPTREELQRGFLSSLEKFHKNYESMIQAESTKTLYKDAIKQLENNDQGVGSNELISAIPSQHRQLLTKPRRPPAAFILFLNHNLDRLKAMARKQKPKGCHFKIAAQEWAQLDPTSKSTYEEIYQKLRVEYLRAMEEYRETMKDSSRDLVDQALRERRAFRRSLRKRLRDASILPLSIRNPFNFFLMDNKDVKLIDLTEVWRNLPEEKKLKYYKLSEADAVRYETQLELYKAIKKGLSQSIGRKAASSEPLTDQ